MTQAKQCWYLLKLYLCKSQANIRFGIKPFTVRNRQLLHQRLVKDRPVLQAYLKRHLGAENYNKTDLQEMFDGVDEFDFERSSKEDLYTFIDYFTDEIVNGFEYFEPNE